MSRGARAAKLKHVCLSPERDLHVTVKSDIQLYLQSCTNLQFHRQLTVKQTLKPMECHKVKSSATNTDIHLNSSKARRILTLNTHEEKRLEKARWNLEKQRTAERKKFLKAKKDVIIHQFGFRKEGWHCSATPILCCVENKDSDKVITKRSNSSAQKNFIHENSCENKGNEKPLSEVLPPIRLPPLHSQKEKTIKEKRHTTLAVTLEKVSKENLWNGLENCRYLRTYKETKRNRHYEAPPEELFIL